jgi:hypothetical protein
LPRDIDAQHVEEMHEWEATGRRGERKIFFRRTPPAGTSNLAKGHRYALPSCRDAEQKRRRPLARPSQITDGIDAQ